MIPCLVSIVAFKILTYIPSERTFIDATHVSMTNETVHILLKSRRTSYEWGTSRTIEYRGYLLDYSPLTKHKKLYEIRNDDTSNRTRYAITDSNIILNETNKTVYDKKQRVGTSIGKRQFYCELDYIDLSLLPYKKSNQSSCDNSNQKNIINSLSYEVRDTNLWRWNSEDLHNQWLKDSLLYGRINNNLRFKRPGSYGDYFRVVDNDGNVIAEKPSITSSRRDKVLQVGVPFEFSKNEILSELSFERESRVLGLLDSGQLLIAFDFTWAAKESILLVKWDLNLNTTQLLDRIYYTDLFSPSTFTLAHSSWWKKMQGFPYTKRHPIVEVISID